MVSVTITFLVDEMKEVSEAVVPIAEQLQVVTIPPAGSQYVKNMANERGSTVNMRVELVPEEDAAMLKMYKKKRKELVKH